jgi:uncharacterized protein YqeY
MLLTKLKTDQLQARKDRDAVRASLLTTLIGEATAIGKNDGNRDTTDAEVIAVIKKFIKNVNEVIRVAGDYRDADRADQGWAEKTILESYLPVQLTGDALLQTIKQIADELNAHTLRDVGKVMGALKSRYDGQYEGTVAVALVKEVLQ